MKTNVSKEECAVVCMLISNPGGSFRKDGDGWQKRANDLIRALRGSLSTALADLAQERERAEYVATVSEDWRKKHADAHTDACRLRERAEKAERDYAACADAIGVQYEADGHATQPGPVEAVVRYIREAVDDADALRGELAECRAELEKKSEHLTDALRREGKALVDGRAAEARAERYRDAIQAELSQRAVNDSCGLDKSACRTLSEILDRRGEDFSLESALAETAPKTDGACPDCDGEGGGHYDCRTCKGTGKAPDDAERAARIRDHVHEVGGCRDCPYDLPEIPDSSPDDAFPVVVGCSVDPYSSRACELGTHGCVVVHAGPLDSVTRNKTESRGIPRTNDDGERRGNIHPEPGTSSPDDDAENEAREFWSWFADVVAAGNPDQILANIAALLRTRDAQAREAGRVEGWGQCVDAVMGCCGGRSHQKLRQRIRALKRHSQRRPRRDRKGEAVKTTLTDREYLRRSVQPNGLSARVLDDLDEAETRAEQLGAEVERLKSLLGDDEPEYGPSPEARAGEALWRQLSAAPPPAGEGDEWQKTSAGVAAPAVEATAHHAPGRDAEEPGSPSGDERWCPKHEVRRTALGCIYCMNEPDGEVPPHAYEDGGSGIGHCLLCGSDNESDGNHVAPAPPATSTPDDDAARAAREWTRQLREDCKANFRGGYSDGYDIFVHGMETVCNVLDDALPSFARARDAQAREAGRADGWNAAVEACAAIPEHMNITRLRILELKRLDRAKGGGER